VRKALTHRDGSREGTIEGLGVTIRLGRNNTARGQLQVESIDSVMDPSVFVDPGLKSAELCDQKRVHVLARLCGLRVARGEWLDLISQLGDIVQVSADDLAGDDPIEVSDRLRRKLHERARAIEKEIEGIQARADVAGEGVDASSDGPREEMSPLHDAVRQAEIEQQVLDRAEQGRLAAADRLVVLQGQIEAAAAIDTDPLHGELAGASREIGKIGPQIQSAEAIIAAARLELLALRARHSAESDRLASANTRLTEADRHNEGVRLLRAKADEALPAEIPAERLLAAGVAVATSRDALEAAVIRNQARDRRDKWERLVAEAGEKRAIAERVREVARSTDSVIEAAFSARGLPDIAISQGRPCIQTDRGLEPVADLSHGERWALILDVVSRNLGPGALVAIEQEAWTALDPENQILVAAMAKRRRVLIITAECTLGDLRAEIFE